MGFVGLLGEEGKIENYSRRLKKNEKFDGFLEKKEMVGLEKTEKENFWGIWCVIGLSSGGGMGV